MWSTENHATGGAHAHFTPGTIVAGNYEVVGEAGTGNFAKVYECRDIRNDRRVAIKFMKRGYERDADFECDILSTVNRKDPSDTCGLVRFVERITHQGLTAIVFTLKGSALKNTRGPLPKGDIQRVITDVASALNFLHFTCRAVHTDLKPDNILAEKTPNAEGRRWCVCDFGSASFYNASSLDHDLITTRPYRAPEVVMKRGWNYNADTWSLGCIVYELFTGRKLFDCQSDGEHLEHMQAKLGPIPAHLNAPRTLGARRGVVSLKDELSREPELYNLLTKLLNFDPEQRPRAGDVLRHPYLTGAAGSTMPSSQVTAADGPSKRLSAVSASTGNISQPMGSKPAFVAPTGAATYQALQQQKAAINHQQLRDQVKPPQSIYTPRGYSGLPHPSTFPKATSYSTTASSYGSGLMSPAMPMQTTNLR